jgi:cyclopropane fatty-acyl-phospholipid synthase-like methyltransferase
MNPILETKLDRLVKLLRLKSGSRVLDIACGKGELLFRLNEEYNIQGIGVDKSPYCVDACNEEKRKRAPEADIDFLLMDGADYKSEYEFDLASCLGGSWVFGDHAGTLKALSVQTRSGGMVLVGEPYWHKEPDPEYLEIEGFTRTAFRSHRENVEAGEGLGLRCLYTLDSDREGWDHYETLHWWAAEDYIQDNPNDVDNAELRIIVEKGKATYLRWGRDTLGWCIYLFRKP